MLHLPTDHGLAVALICPQIAPNTGNIARLCVATGTPLHLVRPMGFVLSDKAIRRSAMDYWPRLQLTVHDDLSAFETAMTGRRLRCFSTKSNSGMWSATFTAGDVLVFGNESSGLPVEFQRRHEALSVRIPQVADERCLNLASAASIGLFEALRNVTGRISSTRYAFAIAFCQR